jgi:DNA-3-methyladenine glycosylase I
MTVLPVRGLVRGADGKLRCAWGAAPPEYAAYHDAEWGRPVSDDARLFEKVCLEGFQSGLSWLTILRKREAFRRAFAGFDLDRVARFGERDVARLLADEGIVRHRGKIEAAIANARRACALRDEFGSLAAYFWRFEPSRGARPRRLTWAVLRRMATTPASVALSKDLRGRGFGFVGPTTMYAFMQAVGIVNDHLDGCAFRLPAERARRDFERPERAPSRPAVTPSRAPRGARDRAPSLPTIPRRGARRTGPPARAPGDRGTR